MTKTMTVTQFSEALGVSRKTVQRWISSGRIRAQKTPGGHWRIDADQVNKQWLRTSEFARAVGICHRTTLRWIASGKLAARTTPGGDYEVAAGEVARYATRATGGSK